MATPLFTTGYSGHDQASFLDHLIEQKIEVVVDVRQNPISRKRGFSRRSLQEFLEANGVEYVHAPSFGVPRELRDKLRDEEMDLQQYLRAFGKHVQRESDALRELYERATKQRCCLLCMEQNHTECHRSVVADAITKLNGRKVTVVHL